jgi:hypothetical protein
MGNLAAERLSRRGRNDRELKDVRVRDVCVAFSYNQRFDLPRQQIRQSVSRQNHPSISDPARINNISRRKRRGRFDRRAILTPTSANPNPPIIPVSNLCHNLEASFV